MYKIRVTVHLSDGDHDLLLERAEVFALLHFSDKTQFPSFQQFIDKWCKPIKA